MPIFLLLHRTMLPHARIPRHGLAGDVREVGMVVVPDVEPGAMTQLMVFLEVDVHVLLRSTATAAAELDAGAAH